MDRTDDIELMRLRVRVIDADRMAAIIDEMVRARHLDPRSKLADARLDYGQPFNPVGMREGAPMLASTALNADYWLKAGRDTADRDEAVLAVEQSANAWRNAAYALAEKLSRTPVPEAAEKNVPLIRGVGLVKMFKDQRDESADVLRRLMHKLREESGSEDPMEPFAYDASWEALANEADAVLAKCPSYTQQLNNLLEGLGITREQLDAALTAHATRSPPAMSRKEEQ